MPNGRLKFNLNRSAQCDIRLCSLPAFPQSFPLLLSYVEIVLNKEKIKKINIFGVLKVNNPAPKKKG